jgi:hypothetical protein
MIPEKSVIQYIRDENKNPRGVLVAVKQDESYKVGYSLCNKKDRFQKKMALKIALARAVQTPFNLEQKLDFDAGRVVRNMLPKFVERCKKYYKIQD